MLYWTDQMRTSEPWCWVHRAATFPVRFSLALPAASRIRGTVLLGSWILAMLAPSPILAEPYRVGPQDKLRVKVIEWRAGKGEYQEWTALNSEYTVNAAGAISLPLVGEVPADGRTTDEIAAAVSDGLVKRAGLVSRPDTAIEVVQFRPVYIIGAVERPGEYAYRPGLTVLQIVGIAGGLHRVTEAGLLRLERDRIVAAGNLESARLELRRTIARRARLEAELQEASEIQTPPELRDEPDAARLLAEETSVMRARRDALRSQLAALAELKDLYAREVQSLDSKMTIQEKQIALARRELKNVGSLVERGLSVTSREFALERTVAELEGKMLDFQAASLRAKQEIGKAERDANDLQQERKAKLFTELQESRANLDQVAAKLKTSSALIDEATITAPRLALERWSKAAEAPVFSIVRRVSRKAVESRAEEGTIVEPGDVIRVDRAPSETSALGRIDVTESEGAAPRAGWR
jgi:exopolysaccharide production protein ExoF